MAPPPSAVLRPWLFPRLSARGPQQTWFWFVGVVDSAVELLVFRSRAIPAMSAITAIPPPLPGYPKVSQIGVGFTGIIRFRPCLACTSATKAQIGVGSSRVRFVFWPRAKGQKLKAKSQRPKAKGQKPRAKSQGPSFASCLLSKTVHYFTFSLWSEFPTLSFCSPFCQGKSALANQEIVHSQGGAGIYAFSFITSFTDCSETSFTLLPVPKARKLVCAPSMYSQLRWWTAGALACAPGASGFCRTGPGIQRNQPQPWKLSPFS